MSVPSRVHFWEDSKNDNKNKDSLHSVTDFRLEAGLI